MIILYILAAIGYLLIGCTLVRIGDKYFDLEIEEFGIAGPVAAGWPIALVVGSIFLIGNLAVSGFNLIVNFFLKMRKKLND